MLIAQITDPHVTADGRGAAGIDGGERLARGLARVAAMSPRPAAIVLSGDLVERGERAEYQRLASIVRDCPVPILPMAGNHDDRDLLRIAFPATAPADDGRWRASRVVDGVRLVLLDSLEPGRPSGRLGGAQLAWLDRELGATSGRPTIVFVHHPPPSTGLVHIDRSALIDADDLAALIRRHSGVVRVACGHLHVALAMNWAGTTLTACPSVAHRFAVDLADDGRIVARPSPGAFQLHRWRAGVLHTYTVSLDEEDPT